jgi:predicted DNA-binding protein YlxM (UPF0122 family)
LQITDERKKRVIDLYFNQHKSYAEIAQIEKISPRDIHAIIKEEEARRQKYEHQQKQEEISSKAYKLFSKGKRPVEVAVALSLREPEANKLFIEYCKLKRLHTLILIYNETNGNLWSFLKLYKQLIKQRDMSIEQVVNIVDIAIHKLPYMESLYRQVKDEVNKLQYTRQGLANDIEAKKNKISILDKIAFSSEQDCRRKEQEVQELTEQKERLEKWITNVMKGEAYSKLKQLVKENVKAILSENKQVISISFTVLIHTLKSDPQMVKLIQNMPSANDSEQYKDNDINVTKYLEYNRDKLSDFAEKNYENLVEALTNNNIETASSNSTLSLPQSSSTFPKMSNQSDTYRIEESEIYDNDGKGDIDD